MMKIKITRKRSCRQAHKNNVIEYESQILKSPDSGLDTDLPQNEPAIKEPVEIVFFRPGAAGFMLTGG